MNASAIIEVVIGMVFVFILMSLLVQQINTIVINILNLRAEHLRKGLQDLIQDPVIRTKVVGHPLINVIEYVIPARTKMTIQQAEKVLTKAKTTQVTQIDPKIFVDALMNVLVSDVERQNLYEPLKVAVENLSPSAEKSLLRQLIHIPGPYTQTISSLRNAIDAIEDVEERRMMFLALDQIERRVAELDVEPNELYTLLQGVHQVRNPKFKDTLEAVLATAETVQEAQYNLERWFQESMNRLSETFARRLVWYSVFASTALVLILNVDSLHLGVTLWNDPAVRTTLVTAAESQIQTGELQELIEETAAAEAAAIEEAAGGATSDLEPPTAEEVEADLEEIAESFREARGTVDELSSLRLPIGWTYVSYRSYDVLGEGLTNPRSNPRNLRNLSPFGNGQWIPFIIRKIIGWLVTIIAVAQGAPFWFGLINRVIGTVK